MPMSLGITSYRLPSLSSEEFKDCYETKHVPLILGLITGDAKPISYRRNYLNRTPDGKPALIVGDTERADWDCFVEVTFTDEEHFKRYMAAYGENMKTIGEHEATFVDTKRVLVATYATEGL